MKILSIIALCTLIAGTAHAQYTGPNSVEHIKMTVAQALDAKDDTKMTLEGKIINNLSDEEYTFQDDTGSMVVEIDNKILRNLTFNENNIVKLIGEVEKDFAQKAEFDVDYIEIIK